MGLCLCVFVQAYVKVILQMNTDLAFKEKYLFRDRSSTEIFYLEVDNTN